MVQQQQQQPHRWRSRLNAQPSVPNNHLSTQPTEGGQGNDSLVKPADSTSNDSSTRSPRTSVSAANANSSNSNNAHRQIIGNYELGRVLATGDFDCRTRLCTHVTTGVPYVVRIYDKHVLAEAQWMWDRVAESIHVLRKLPRNEHILEMVECFESDTSVYILMHLFPSMNLTKLFTDKAAQVELLHRLHILARASLRASAAEREKHYSSGAANSDGSLSRTANDEKRNSGPGAESGSAAQRRHNTSLTSVMLDRPSFHQLKDGRSSTSGASSGLFEVLADREHYQRPTHYPPNGTTDEKRSSASVFPDALSSTSIATAAAICALEGPVPSRIPLALTRVLFEQVVKGVAFLHQNGVVHTGIAPDHLLVSPEGLLRIGNMVSACFCAPGERLHELRGTMHTVAPEVLRGEAYDPFMADAWALGVVLYFMLNQGRYPHDGANTLRHILHGHTRPPRAGLPAVALDLLSRLMQAKPEDRLPVDAILAHPFFTAPLPTVEEEMTMADAADELARNARRSVCNTVNPSPSQKTSDALNANSNSDHHHHHNNNRVSPFDSRASNNSNMSSGNPAAAAAAARGGNRRWGRGAGGNEDEDPNALTGLWSTLHQHPHATIFSANSESNSVVIGGEGMSTTFDALDGTTVPAGGAFLGASNSGHGGGVDTLDAGDTFIPRRQSIFIDGGRSQRLSGPPRSPHNSCTDAADFYARVVALGNPGQAGDAATKRPLWRPELAPSIDALEDLAARVIQHHFRTVLHRRRYKAETRALMKRGQSMYISASSSSREGAGGGAAAPNATDAVSRRRSFLHTRRSSLSSIHAPYVSDTPVGSPCKSQHPFHQRISAPWSQSNSNTSVGVSPHVLSLSPWRRRLSPPHSYGSTVPSSGATTAVAAMPLSPSTPKARWPASIGLNGGGSNSGAGVSTPFRGYFNSSSVTINTRGGSSPHSYSANGPHGDDEDNAEGKAGEHSSSSFANNDGLGSGGSNGGCGRQLRTGSLTLPSLAATACGTDLVGELSQKSPQQQQQSQMRLQGGGSNTTNSSSNRMPNTSIGNASLLSQQQGRRRSMITAVLSSVVPTRASSERQRSNGSAVLDGEACPLCHREPYAIRSIASRPYASTPYQFSGGEFRKLLE